MPGKSKKSAGIEYYYCRHIACNCYSTLSKGVLVDASTYDQHLQFQQRYDRQTLLSRSFKNLQNKENYSNHGNKEKRKNDEFIITNYDDDTSWSAVCHCHDNCRDRNFNNELASNIKRTTWYTHQDKQRQRDALKAADYVDQIHNNHDSMEKLKIKFQTNKNNKSTISRNDLIKQLIQIQMTTSHRRRRYKYDIDEKQQLEDADYVEQSVQETQMMRNVEKQKNIIVNHHILEEHDIDVCSREEIQYDSLNMKLPQPEFDIKLNEPLYEHCRPFLTKAMHSACMIALQSKHKLSLAVISDVYEIINLHLPKHIKLDLPVQRKNKEIVLNLFHLPEQKITICPNDCMLIVGNNAKLEKEAKENGELNRLIHNKVQDIDDRYSNSTPLHDRLLINCGNEECKTRLYTSVHRIARPIKVLRYFPFADYVRRLYSSPYISKQLSYAYDYMKTRQRYRDILSKPVKDLTNEEWDEYDIASESCRYMHDIQDSPGWKEQIVDSGFIADSTPLNLVINIYTDGINPFKLQTPCSLWPVIVVINNYDPRIRMKLTSIFLSALSSGRNNPQNLDPYIAPLLHEIDQINDDEVDPADVEARKRQIWVQDLVRDPKGEFKRVKVKILLICGDYPAQCKLLKHKQGGRYSCTRCTDEGISIETFRSAVVRQVNTTNAQPAIDEKTQEPQGIKLKSRKSGQKTVYFQHFFRFEDPNPNNWKMLLKKDKKWHEEHGAIAESCEISEKDKDAMYATGKKGISILDSLDDYDPLLQTPPELMHMSGTIIHRILLLAFANTSKQKRPLTVDDVDIAVSSEELTLVRKRVDGILLPPGIINRSTLVAAFGLSYYTLEDLETGKPAENVKSKKDINCVFSSFVTSDLHHLCGPLLKYVLMDCWNSKSMKVLKKQLFNFLDILKSLLSMVLPDDSKLMDVLHMKLITSLSTLEGLLPRSTFSIQFHQLVHAVVALRRWGPAKGYWMYPIERYLGELARSKTSQKSPEASIINSHKQKVSTYLLGCDVKDKHLLPNCVRNKNPQFNTDYRYVTWEMNKYKDPTKQYVDLTNIKVKCLEQAVHNSRKDSTEQDHFYDELCFYYRHYKYRDVYGPLFDEWRATNKKFGVTYDTFMVYKRNECSHGALPPEQEPFARAPDHTAMIFKSVYIRGERYPIRVAARDDQYSQAKVVSSYVSVAYHNTGRLGEEDDVDTKVWHGQVMLLIRHRFANEDHDLAYIDYFSSGKAERNNCANLICTSLDKRIQKDHFVPVNQILGRCAIARAKNSNHYIIPMYEKELETYNKDELKD